MFGVTKEEVEAIVDKKICKATNRTQFITSKPRPPPIVWEYMVAVNNNKEVVYLQVENGKQPTLYYVGFIRETYSIVSDKRFKDTDAAMEWVVENEHYIEDAGFTIGVGTKAYKLKKVLDA